MKYLIETSKRMPGWFSNRIRRVCKPDPLGRLHTFGSYPPYRNKQGQQIMHLVIENAVDEEINGSVIGLCRVPPGCVVISEQRYAQLIECEQRLTTADAAERQFAGCCLD